MDRLLSLQGSTCASILFLSLDPSTCNSTRQVLTILAIPNSANSMCTLGVKSPTVTTSRKCESCCCTNSALPAFGKGSDGLRVHFQPFSLESNTHTLLQRLSNKKRGRKCFSQSLRRHRNPSLRDRFRRRGSGLFSTKSSLERRGEPSGAKSRWFISLTPL
jgi:hypothetical protein